MTRRLLATTSAVSERTFGSYHEASIGIPGVRRARRCRSGPLRLRMYTDSPLARVVDKALKFGFRKQAAFFAVSELATELKSPSGRSLISLRHSPLGADESLVEPPPAALEHWLRQPLLGRAEDGKLVRTSFWRSELSMLESTVAELKIAESVPLLGRAAAAIGLHCRHPPTARAFRSHLARQGRRTELAPHERGSLRERPSTPAASRRHRGGLCRDSRSIRAIASRAPR